MLPQQVVTRTNSAWRTNVEKFVMGFLFENKDRDFLVH